LLRSARNDQRCHCEERSDEAISRQHDEEGGGPR
jgi:hypothetical protein